MGTFSDNFNAYSDGLLSDHTAWLDSLNGVDVISSEINAGTVGLNLSYVDAAFLAFDDDQEAEVEVTVSGNFDDAGPACRVTAAGNGYYVTYEPATPLVRLTSIASGSATQIGVSNPEPVALTDKLKILASGTTISVELDSGSGFVEIISVTDSDHSSGQPGIFYNFGNNNSSRVDNFSGTDATASAVITGTMTAAVDEDDITAGGKTIIITLTGDTFKSAGTGPIGSTADTQALIDGFDAASSPANGWNNEVRDNALTSEVVRTSSTAATWTVADQSGYDISAQETVTPTIPIAVLVIGDEAITGAPTFTIDAVGVGGFLNRNLFWDNY